MNSGRSGVLALGSTASGILRGGRQFLREGNGPRMKKYSPGQSLREAARAATIAVPGAPSALAGMLIERSGFSAAYISGAAFSAGVLGLPDVGLFGLKELAEHTRQLTRRITIPVIVDADTGFGEAVQVARTVEELEAAGAAAIQIEDQVLPKRCGHLSGKQLIDIDAMCTKLRAAVAARQDQQLVLIARTDARGVTGWDDAVARARCYLDAGADWIFPEALESRDEFARFADAVAAPLVANMTEFGRSPLLNMAELSAMRYAAVLFPVTLLRMAMKAMQTALESLAAEGTQNKLLDRMLTRADLYALLDYEAFAERDRQYFGERSDHE
jgi:methylisocitrate lyase